MKEDLAVLDAVALNTDLPEEGLQKGEVGTIVELLGHDTFEVEFSNENGETYAELAIPGNRLLLLHNKGKGWRVAA